MVTFIDGETRYITAHGGAWTVEPSKTRIVIRGGRNPKILGSWRMTRDRGYQLYRENQPLEVTDWLGNSHPVLAPDRDAAIARCEAITYYLMATLEYRSDLDSSMTELVMWSQRHVQLTRRTPSVVGELGEFYAIKALGLARASERQEGFDGWNRDGQRVQIKCRQVYKRENGDSELNGVSLPRVRRDHEWDSLMLVLIDSKFRLQSIHEMTREAIDETWPVQSLSRGGASLNIGVGQFINAGSERFGPRSYWSRSFLPWSRFPKGKLLPAMPSQIGLVSLHLGPAESE